MTQQAGGSQPGGRRSERFAETTAGLAFILSALAASGLAALYALGGQPQLEGALLATTFAGLAYGLVTWANRLMPAFGQAALTDNQLNDLAAYVRYLDHPDDRGGEPLWHLGPMAEGGVAVICGLGIMLLTIRWIGDKE